MWVFLMNSCLLAELLLGQALFPGEKELEQMNRIFRVRSFYFFLPACTARLSLFYPFLSILSGAVVRHTDDGELAIVSRSAAGQHDRAARDAHAMSTRTLARARAQRQQVRFAPLLAGARPCCLVVLIRSCRDFSFDLLHSGASLRKVSTCWTNC